ncbi:MAG TPA: ABC transporter permease [Dehalococcoidia bacterium]|nr:ABC transporter permease [Dehalococcoidia bacterium]
MNSFREGIIQDITHAYIDTQYELRKHLRRKRLAIAVILAVIVPLLFYLVPWIWNLGYPDDVASFAENYMGFTNLLIIVCAALFAADAISGEFEKKTALLTFPTPQRRTSILAGKYIAALIPTFIMVSVYYLIITVEAGHIYSFASIPSAMLKSYLLALLYACSVVSVAFLFSSFLKGTVSSTLLTFFALLMILPLISMFVAMAEVEPWFIVTYSANLLTTVFGVAGFGLEHGEATFTPDLTTGIVVMAAYAVILFIGSIFVFARREVE